MPTQSESSTPAASMTPRMFCKKCGYALVGLESRVCPECGRAFDPANRRTFATRPPRGWVWRWGRRVLALVLLLALTAGAGVGWLWWGWHAEQPTIARLGALQQGFTVAPIGPERLRWMLGKRWGYLVERVDWAVADEVGPAETEQLHFESLTQIKDLRLMDCELSNSHLSHLAALNKLQSLILARLQIKNPDLAFLESLPALSWLGLSGKWVGDTGLEHLKGLNKLKVLILLDAGVTDADLKCLTPLSSLEKLSLAGNPISDTGLENLKNITSLRFLRVDKRLLESSGAAKLRQAIPALQIIDRPWDTPHGWPPPH